MDWNKRKDDLSVMLGGIYYEHIAEKIKKIVDEIIEQEKEMIEDVLSKCRYPSGDERE